MKARALPLLAVSLLALSTAACTGDRAARTASGTQTTSSTAMTGTQAASAASDQALAQPMIQRVQRQLSARGYNAGAADGVWGDETASALRNFQRDQGMQATGQIDERTLAALGVMGSGAALRSQQAPRRGAMMDQERRRMASAASPQMVRDIQSQLQQQGYRVGEVDGVWGPKTREAVSAFQRDQNLRASGQIDQQTLAALGITGSQVGQTPAESGEQTRSEPRSEPQEELRTTEPPSESELPPSDVPANE